MPLAGRSIFPRPARQAELTLNYVFTSKKLVFSERL